MEDFSELCRELERHREAMFFTIGRTLQDAADMFDAELVKTLKATCEIYDSKYPTFKNSISGRDQDYFWGYILNQFLKNYEDEHFSFSWVESYDQLKSLIAPITDDKAYQDFLSLTKCTGQSTLTFGEQIFFLAGAFRFYREFGTKEGQNLSINDDVSTILRIDREVSFIREEIYSAVATRKKTAESVKITTGTNITNALKRPDLFGREEQEYMKVFIEVANKKRGRPLSFSKFTDITAVELDRSNTHIIEYLKKLGVTKKNFNEWLSNLKKSNLT
ncbi:hypothetical protein JWJ90_17010 [Desulfobulbus rhabdoformis]|uniref:hypothetical protein n=1 Tax=Desulfobulbus rhabdoformis TaxID=34032 RepID=UPI001965CAB4|nr:hypothetical protein [Desulfobulbus rhabdoformis]MBM9615971.1 hypothetical protein [Desulfobulbus rhabdoformis]